MVVTELQKRWRKGSELLNELRVISNQIESCKDTCRTCLHPPRDLDVDQAAGFRALLHTPQHSSAGSVKFLKREGFTELAPQYSAKPGYNGQSCTTLVTHWAGKVSCRIGIPDAYDDLCRPGTAEMPIKLIRCERRICL